MCNLFILLISATEVNDWCKQMNSKQNQKKSVNCRRDSNVPTLNKKVEYFYLWIYEIGPKPLNESIETNSRHLDFRKVFCVRNESKMIYNCCTVAYATFYFGGGGWYSWCLNE